MDDFSSNIRSSALKKLAALAVQSPAVDEESDIARLTEQCEHAAGQDQPNGVQNGASKSQTSTAQVPMSTRELDVLLALCKASPSVKEPKHASRLVTQLSKYLPESHSQVFRTSPFLHNVKPSPWESLTYNLTSALLSLGSSHSSLRDTVFYAINEYLYSCAEAIDAQSSRTDKNGVVQDPPAVLSIAVSLVGFLDASSQHTAFWAASEKLQIIEHLRSMLTEKLMIAVETAASTARNTSTSSDSPLRDWKKYARRYTARGRPFSALFLQEGYMRFIKSCTLSLLGSQKPMEDEILEDQMNGVGIARSHGDADISLIQCITQIVNDEMHLLDDGFDYLQLGSSWQQRLTHSVKALAITAFLNCVILAEDIAGGDALVSWLEDTMADPNQMSSVELGSAVLKCMAIISRMSANNATSGTRSLMRFILHGGVHTGPIVAVAARCLAQTLGVLSQDSLITTMYSLGNALSSGSRPERAYQAHSVTDAHGRTTPATSLSPPANRSVVSFSASGEEEHGGPYKGIIHAIVTIATSSHDEKIAALAQSMLLQKMGKINVAVDACIIQETAALAPTTGKAEFQLLLKFYARVYRDGPTKGGNHTIEAVRNAMTYLSITLERTSPLHRIYLVHLLESIVNKGDVTELELERQKEVTLSSNDIIPLLKPLALLVSSGEDATTNYDEDIASLFRDTWFNFAVHGITVNSAVARDHFKEMCLLAKYSPPLVAEGSIEMLESDVELNTVLRRGMGQPQHIMEQKKALTTELPSNEPEIKRLNYPRIVFLNASLLLETLRASSGDCTKFLSYFRDPALATMEVASCMNAIAERVVNSYLTLTLSGKHEDFSISFLSKQLTAFFAACCYRIERVQSVAVLSANKIIRECPSALCERDSIFALLELLTVMWSSCLEEDLDEYEWKPSYTSPRGNVHVDLPDSYSFRRTTLGMFHERAKAWMATVMDISPFDVKGLLQSYLSESEDDGGYGNVALGRSFALEIGSSIPLSDRRLGSMQNYGVDKVNVASGFVAQYTTRQNYRYPVISTPETDISNFDMSGKGQVITFQSPESPEHVENMLSQLHERAEAGNAIPASEIRDALRRAAAVLCTEQEKQPSIVHYFVNLPFRIFSKEAMGVGVSLWLAAINENPRIEPRIMAEVTEAWEETIRRRRGLFSPSFDYVDPLYAKIELLPTDKELMLKKQQKAQNLLAPHSLVLQFFESHFSAVKLGNSQSRRFFCRLIGRTATGLLETHGHPLAREIHFRIIAFGLRVLNHFHAEDRIASWKLKDQILSAALSWFKHTPRWSFGGNRLQLKAEDKILRDVSAALTNNAAIASQTHGPYKSLQAKQDLLQIFIENERSRLKVWLYPLEPEKKHFIGPTSGNKNVADEAASLLWLAWEENPGLAIQLAARHPSPKLRNDVRWLLLNFPYRALEEPESLEIMLGGSLPADVSTQLKYLLYWAPVNPTEALTYFLPAYGNHPFILQYAMRALESHSIDVRFYFVPQLVQALRYDALGYVERYILETAKQSQLFAHQVIWNMKANSYKDEDAQVPDPLKPTLDRFMDELISSFSSEEREFYEREFSFFNDITGISGTLRPYIKRSKPEKKEKIEEELRKIKVEVGVYLPSNPDGVVVGIDRKSGKPLQSHAKAPYMATFRIQKTRTRDDGGVNGSNQQQQQLLGSSDANPEAHQETYDVWQSAIFKVGDDCRQDMLALQMIAAFRGIFSSVGLDVWVFPYRVTSTAPGCGVIDVLPNSISRDMLGREAVNGLYDYFISKYGGEDSIRFQEARTRFVKSMAAYSLITYLLQFKDRHNGNIMVDDAGHIIHIDFGFCFDIAPGGVRFERAPFKLTSEMIAVMGGGPAHPHAPGMAHTTSTQPYRWFESLVVKAFLASRPYCTKLQNIVSLMLDSGLPCFKPETLKNFRDRFVLEKSERDAAEFMRDQIRKSYMNMSTKGYDQFQLLTNGIPY